MSKKEVIFWISFVLMFIGDLFSLWFFADVFGLITVFLGVFILADEKKDEEDV